MYVFISACVCVLLLFLLFFCNDFEWLYCTAASRHGPADGLEILTRPHSWRVHRAGHQQTGIKTDLLNATLQV